MLAGLVDLTAGETEKNGGDALGLQELQEQVKSNQGLSPRSLGAAPPGFWSPEHALSSTPAAVDSGQTLNSCHTEMQ
jgi:hypothetical protein